MTTALVLALLLQADPAKEVERLRSDSVEERDEAAKALKELGSKAIPALEKATGDSDRELAGQARLLLSAIRIREALTPAFRKAWPGIEERLARSEAAWGEAVAQIKPKLGEPPWNGLEAADWAPFAAGAAKAARSHEERTSLCDLCKATRLRPPPAEMLPFLETGNAQVLTQTLAVLARSTRASDATAILPLLKHSDPEVRSRAIMTLGELRVPGTGPAILERLRDTAPAVRSSVLVAAGAMGLREAFREVVALIDDPEQNVRSVVPLVLAQWGGKEATARVALLLRHADFEVRSSAVKALGLLGAEKELEAVVELLKDGHEFVRREAVEQVGNWGLSAAIPDLLRLLEDPDVMVSGSASTALISLGAAGTVGKLKELLGGKENLQARRNAALALGGLGLREALPDLRNFLRLAPATASGDAARALAQLGDRDSLPGIRDLLRTLEERSDVFLALGMLQDQESASKLSGMAESGGNRGEILNTLAQMGDRSAIPGLRGLVRDYDPGARNMGALGLATLDSTVDAPLVERLLDDEEVFVRSSALMALCLLESKASIPAMERLLGDPEVDVRLDAARYLAGLGSRAGLSLLFERSRMPSELNALRRPEAWERLRKIRAGGNLSGTTSEVLKRIGTLASRPLVLPSGEEAFAKAWLEKGSWVPDYGHSMTLIDVLQMVANGPYEFVLETDAIRILPRKEARALWRAWWEAERK